MGLLGWLTDLSGTGPEWWIGGEVLSKVGAGGVSFEFWRAVASLSNQLISLSISRINSSKSVWLGKSAVEFSRTFGGIVPLQDWIPGFSVISLIDSGRLAEWNVGTWWTVDCSWECWSKGGYLGLLWSFFTKKPGTETNFFLKARKGGAQSQGSNFWSSGLREPSFSIQISQSLLACIRQQH